MGVARAKRGQAKIAFLVLEFLSKGAGSTHMDDPA